MDVASVEDLGLGESARPTVGQMLLRDIFVYTAIISPFTLAIVILVVSGIQEEGTEEVELTYLYGLLVLDVAASFVMVYWRRGLYSSVLVTGVEVPATVASVKRSGESTVVEYEYRWQAETVRSSKRVRGYLQRSQELALVGARATILVDASRPQRFLVLDTLR